MFENLFGQATIAAGGYLSIGGSGSLNIDGLVTYKGDDPVGAKAGYVPPKTKKELTIPSVEKTEAQIWENYGGPPDTEVDGLKGAKIVIEEDTIVRGSVKLSESGGDRRLEVKNGSWLVIDGGNLEIAGSGTFTLELNGNILVIGGAMKIAKSGTTNVTGEGMIITIPPKGGQGVVLGGSGAVGGNITVVSTGSVEISRSGSIGAALFVYGSQVTFTGSGLSALTCSIITPGDVKITKSGTSVLKGGDSDRWTNQPDVQGGGSGDYKIIGWDAGGR